MQIAGFPVVEVEDLPRDYGRFLIHGAQGSGKTLLASTIAKLGPTLFIDLNGEKGVQSFRGESYTKNIHVIRPDSITALDDIYNFLADPDKHEFVAVVVDSLTSVQKMTMRYLQGHEETAVSEIRKGVAPADQRTWGQALDVMNDIAIFWHGLADGNRPRPMHVVMTAQTKILEDEVNQVRSRMPDVQRGALSITLAAPDYILYTDQEPDMENIGEDGTPATRHVVRFGSHPGYRTKARVPVHLRGKIPSILGRKTPPDLAALSRKLEIGGSRPAGAATNKESTE